MKPRKLGLPYKGSKRKLASKIVDEILTHNPNTKYVYDLFGGGGAVSFELLSRGIEVYYNEINRGVVELLKDVIENGVTSKYYQWVDRETFMKHRFNNDWFGGFVSVIFSFGNDLKSYLYGKHIEDLKYKAHEAIVNCNKQYMSELQLSIDCKKDIQQRRLQVQRQAKVSNIKRAIQLERIQHLLNINRLTNITNNINNNLKITSRSYNEVDITTSIEETIIYLDPPYRGTNKYQDLIDYDAFYTWIRNCPYKVYISEYNMPIDFKVIKEYNHRAINGASINNEVVEKLFVKEQ